MPRSRATRVLRGTIAASVATFVALMSHVAAGGALPNGLGVAVPWVLSLAVCTVLAGRKLSLTRMSVAVGVSQILFHSLFAVGISSGISASHAHHSSMPIIVGESAAIDPMMWIAHAVAAFITIAALYRGEATFGILLKVARDLLFRARRRIQALPVAPRLSPPVLAEPQALRPLGWVPALTPRRGPPLLSA